MADINQFQVIPSVTSGATAGSTNPETTNADIYTVPAGKKAQCSYMNALASGDDCYLEVYQVLNGSTEKLIWRKEDGFADPAPTDERPIDFLERWMNGIILEAADVLRVKLTTTATQVRTCTGTAWITERDA